jgi:integrase
LVRLGFLRYVENAKEKKFDLLFPDSKIACDEKRSTWFQKPWARYLTRIGIKKERKQNFHAFRHTWNEGLRRSDVPLEIRKRLGGWKADNSAESGYGGEHLPTLFRYLRKLSYPGLELDRLTPSSSHTAEDRKNGMAKLAELAKPKIEATAKH